MRRGSLVAFSLLVAAPYFGAGSTFSSGLSRVSLIELFTSEGCSSCPPAEKWLGGLREDARLWREFVPVAFHVDYWDRLGWRDVFARKEFTQREYAYAAAWKSGSVYTPCFVRNGAEWRSRSLDLPAQVAVGELTVTVDRDGETVSVVFRPVVSDLDENWHAHVALLGGAIDSRVRAGENAGRTLRHEFVALALADVGLSRVQNGSFAASLPLPDVPVEIKAEPVALAAWVTRGEDVEILQATGGWLGE